MEEGKVLVYYGNGRGKTGAAIGKAIRMAGLGKSGMVIRFLKGREESEEVFLQRLEPELKLFRFSKSDGCFSDLSRTEQREETMNLRNGFNYSRKVISTGGCDVIVLDDLLGLVDLHIIEEEDVREMLSMRPEEMTIILTGQKLSEGVRKLADEVYNISKE